jgi:hypothetical protein
VWEVCDSRFCFSAAERTSFHHQLNSFPIVFFTLRINFRDITRRLSVCDFIQKCYCVFHTIFFHVTCVYKIALLYEIAHSPNFWHAILARIACSLVQEKQNTNHRNSLKTLNNQTNSKIVQIIRPKCPRSLIGAK